MLSEAAYYSLRTMTRNHGVADVLDALADICHENKTDHEDADLTAMAAIWSNRERQIRDLSKTI